MATVEDVLEAVVSAAVIVTAEDVAQQLSISSFTAGALLAELVLDHSIERSGRGYRPAPMRKFDMDSTKTSWRGQEFDRYATFRRHGEFLQPDWPLTRVQYHDIARQELAARRHA